MSDEYRNNHYVPRWYQGRFLPAGCKDKELFYLDLRPMYLADRSGVCQPYRVLRRLGFDYCFAERDLYTTEFGPDVSTDVEKFFFGRVDSDGRRAARYFEEFKHPSADGEALRALLRYMATQRLRSPKGLAWLRSQTRARTKPALLQYLQELEFLYAAIWCESIWQIADASLSPTKFVVSDHPVTVYNRDCPPTSPLARGSNDPDIRLHGTHTIFPLSLDKVLIITNLSWVRNPFQPARGWRPNPNLFRGGMFDFQKIQTMRPLSEEEVIAINYIIKRRAFRFIAAAEREWLHPEKKLRLPAWRNVGGEYLLMPDPRSVVFTGRIMVGHWDGSSSAWDEYGLRPWERGFDDRGRSTDEWSTFHRFVGEFAAHFGPARRGRAFRVLRIDPERDSDETHATHLRYRTEYDRFMTF